MLDWIGIDQSMKMSESSRGVDKKLHGNNIRLFRPMVMQLLMKQ